MAGGGDFRLLPAIEKKARKKNLVRTYRLISGRKKHFETRIAVRFDDFGMAGSVSGRMAWRRVRPPSVSSSSLRLPTWSNVTSRRCAIRTDACCACSRSCRQFGNRRRLPNASKIRHSDRTRPGRVVSSVKKKKKKKGTGYALNRKVFVRGRAAE